jgi:excisionase family DNA binding protein
MLSSEPLSPIDPIIFGLRKAAYTPAEVMDLINISRAPFYRLVKDGEIKIARHGTRTLVLAADLARLLLKMRNEGLPSRPKRPGERARYPAPKET